MLTLENSKINATYKKRKNKLFFYKLKTRLIQFTYFLKNLNKLYILLLTATLAIFGVIKFYPIKNINIQTNYTLHLINSQDLSTLKLQIKNKPFFTTSSKSITYLINKNPKISKAETIKTKIGTINIKIYEVKYIAKYKYNDRYYFITSKKTFVQVPEALFNQTHIPVIKDIPYSDLKLLLNNITLTLNLLNIPYFKPTSIRLHYQKWETPAMIIFGTYKNKGIMVILDPNKDIPMQIEKLKLTLEGLNAKHIKFKTIDLRFDMIIIK